MEILFIDYTHTYFSDVVKADALPVIKGKFVRLRHGDRDYVVLAPGEFMQYHANILERFCGEHGIEGRYDAEGKRFDLLDPSWIVLGGGKFSKDREKRTIRLYDDSMAYGKFEKQGLREAIIALPEFAGFTVLIE